MASDDAIAQEVLMPENDDTNASTDSGTGTLSVPAANQRAGEQVEPGRGDSPDSPERPAPGVFRSGAPSGEVAPS